MPETGFTRTPRDEREGLASLRAGVRAGLAAARASSVVRTLLVVSVLAGLSSEVFDRLWTARVVEAFTLPQAGLLADPATWFTGVRLLGTVLALVVSLVVNRWTRGLVTADHPTRLLALLTAVQAVGIAAFALSPSLWPAMVAMWLRDAARAVAAPVQGSWLNRSLEPGTRATVLSIVSQADAVGQTAGGPPLGLLATRTSIPVAMLMSSALLVPAAWALRRSPDPVTTAQPLLEPTIRP
jgi:DHA3 family tetracycline resistance protein-like MFS transporter